MVILRKFKRHYHVTKEAYLDAAQDTNFQLGLTISQKHGEPLNYSEKSPDRAKVSRLAVLIYEFLNERSELHYEKVLNFISSEFPKAISKKRLKAINAGIKKIETGGMPLTYNDQALTAKEIFQTISNAGYFNRDEKAVKLFAAIREVPLAEQLFWFQFKNYCFEVFPILSAIFDLIQEVEKHPEYELIIKPKGSEIKKCIYCLSDDGTFTSEEHIFPETLLGDEIYLPKGYVCDKCNNGISSILDNLLIKFEPIAFLWVQFTPYTKGGKLPKVSFGNMTIEKTDPNHIQITAKDKSARPRNEKILDDGQHAFNLQWTGRKLDWKRLARAIYKIALGFVAYDHGHGVALNEKYQPVRDFILTGNSFPNNMLVSTKSKPHPSVRSYSDLSFGGTPYFIDIFGMIFFVNLEHFPLVRKHELENEAVDELLSNYEFQLISLF